MCFSREFRLAACGNAPRGSVVGWCGSVATRMFTFLKGATVSATVSDRTATTSTPILDVLAERWSPRAFDPAGELEEQKLTAALEAARWSPSASNSQPWRFIVARRGTVEFSTIEGALMGFNRVWAGAAGALIVAVTEVADAEGKARPWAHYDLGQAMAHFSIQAHADGLHVHQMGGFKADAIRSGFELPERFVPVTVAAVGLIGPPDALPEAVREREVSPRVRRPLAESLITL